MPSLQGALRGAASERRDPELRGGLGPAGRGRERKNGAGQGWARSEGAAPTGRDPGRRGEAGWGPERRGGT